MLSDKKLSDRKLFPIINRPIMPTYDTAIIPQLDEQLASIIKAAPMMPLNDSGQDRATVSAIQAWLKSQPNISETCLAGLWLLAGDLDGSHALSQKIETMDGSYWHGIMHRREGDYYNAQYWMRRTSRHPVTEELQRRATEYRDAVSFVDYVEKAVTRDQSLKAAAQRVQWLEWQLLFAHGYSSVL